MVIHNTITFMQEYARTTGKFCMYISWTGQNDPKEIIKAAPYMKDDEDMLYTMSEAVLVFDTKEEMYSHYDMTVSDEPVHVYTLTCDNAGNLATKNT